MADSADGREVVSPEICSAMLPAGRTTSEAVLTERMNEMTLTDLQSMAIGVGILPSGNKLNLKTKIMKAFKSHGGAGAGYNIGFQKPLVDPTSKAAEDILKISREGF